ncbi:putative GTPase (G3E family) [Hahella chejuensis KCTC 2396]|uniref:Putative GTPase (G3E family) n=1 Tax=Hahella chejuensis (strain KCTC 2396) TaxID=349521 RepID=Q2SME9_HAHCH|nr:GTP-binding protein [Hahella chejuensis]ABC28175.1 putative GTPase (G3E family) [Hahella chejuensis KCTC 2396]
MPTQEQNAVPNRIPTSIITGFLGAGKTTAILHLLDQKPANETWAVLVNEFGEVGIDGAILSSKGALVKEVPGGCMCCVNGLPMQIGLNMLLARKPDRLLIEPTGLGHPDEIIATLNGEHYRDIVRIQATMTLLDPRKINDTRYSENENFRKQIQVADILVANKTDLCSEDDKQAFYEWVKTTRPDLHEDAIGWIKHGRVDPSWLQHTAAPSDYSVPAPPESKLPFIDIALAPKQDIVRKENRGDGYFSCGWVFSPKYLFDMKEVLNLVYSLDVERCKGVFRTTEGAAVINAENGGVTVYTVAEAPDSRIEVIDRQALEVESLETLLNDILISETTT